VDSATLDHDNSHSARASVQRHVLFGGHRGVGYFSPRRPERHPLAADPAHVWVGQRRLPPAGSVDTASPTSAAGGDEAIGGQQAVVGGLVGGAGAVLAWAGCLCHNETSADAPHFEALRHVGSRQERLIAQVKSIAGRLVTGGHGLLWPAPPPWPSCNGQS